MIGAPAKGLSGERYALEGRIVIMDASFGVLEKGTVYVEAGRIAAVRPTGSPPPPGFGDIAAIGTRGTIYPGLIDLHNHLSYNALKLWEVPERYTNRGQWQREPDYRRLISGPMNVLGRTPGYVEAITRYAECKCLLGGVTTAQGIALFSNQGISRYYRGVVRNVEQTDDADLPEALTRIADVEAEDAGKFLARLRKSSCLLLHLSEGTDERSRQHFEALRLSDGTWAITGGLAGIHCVALEPEDHLVLRQNGGAMVWSPLSNLLLYGQTADIRAAREHGVRLGLGSDWSSTGSKSLLGELKVARLAGREAGLSDRELVAVATSGAAEILKWEGALGSIEAGKRADLLVVGSRSGDPYAALLEARETEITLVVIEGVPRYGNERLMGYHGPGTERWRVGTAKRVLNLSQEEPDPATDNLKLREAEDRLRDGLRRLPELARRLESPTPEAVRAAAQPQWFLVLDHEEPVGVALRPRLHFGPDNLPTAFSARAEARGQLSELLAPLELDPLTVRDDESFFDRLSRQRNLPDYVKEGLPELF